MRCKTTLIHCLIYFRIERTKKKKFDKIVYPEAGVGTGIAELPEKAHETYKFVQ